MDKEKKNRVKQAGAWCLALGLPTIVGPTMAIFAPPVAFAAIGYFLIDAYATAAIGFKNCVKSFVSGECTPWPNYGFFPISYGIMALCVDGAPKVFNGLIKKSDVAKKFEEEKLTMQQEALTAQQEIASLQQQVEELKQELEHQKFATKKTLTLEATKKSTQNDREQNL